MSQCTYVKQTCLGDASNVFVECKLVVEDEALHCRRRLDDGVVYRDMWDVVDTITPVTSRELNQL